MCSHSNRDTLEEITVLFNGKQTPIMHLVGASPDALVLNAENKAAAVVEVKCRPPFIYNKQRKDLLQS
jgi:hypothetical protein